jgi:hypothetical protein
VNTSEILTRAADLIEQRGWNQGWYVNACGGLCARGAIYAAAGHEPLFLDVNGDWFAPVMNDRDVDRAERFLDGFVGVHAASWNDTVARSAADVTAALRGAAEAARAEQ